MAPDLNSLPPSRSRSTSGIHNSNMTRSSTSSENPALRSASPASSPRAASTSLQAAAAVNAGLQQEQSRRNSNSSISRNQQGSQVGGRRRSAVLMNLQLNDPTLPPPGEMIQEGSPYHNASPPSVYTSPTMMSSGGPQLPQHFRAPSLGEIHQELEQEQEAQVNRLLQMIRTQQLQLQQLQAAGPDGTPPVIDELTPVSEQSPPLHNLPTPHSVTPRSPITVPHIRSSFEMAQTDLQHRRSRTPSRTTSPFRNRGTSISNGSGPVDLAGRDESAFYQAEAQMMIRENQMLRQRVRELERQVNEMNVNSAITHEPATPSNLLRSESISEETASSIAPIVHGEIKEEAVV